MSNQNEALLKILELRPDVLADKLNVSDREALNFQHFLQVVLMVASPDHAATHRKMVNAYLKQLTKYH